MRYRIFYPSRGKYHLIGGCLPDVALVLQPEAAIHVSEAQARVHPIVCQKCLRVAFDRTTDLR